jgi:hypothetical protein
MGYYEKVFVRRGTKFANVMPHSEVCMHMGIAGKTMGCELVGERPMVQLFEIESQSAYSDEGDQDPELIVINVPGLM